MLRELQRLLYVYQKYFLLEVQLTAVRGFILFSADDKGTLPSSLTVLERLLDDLGFFCDAELRDKAFLVGAIGLRRVETQDAVWVCM